MQIATTLYKKQFIFLGLIVHLITAIFSYGAHHSDELFQVFEFAGYKLGINQATELPWEFSNHMRSGLLPFLVVVFTKTAHFFSIQNPFLIATGIRICISFASFYAIFLLANFFESELKQIKFKNALWFLTSLFWFLPYFHARLLSENVASTLFLFGFVLILKNHKSEGSISKLFFGGFLLGLAFICRFQISFMISGLVAWLVFINKCQLKSVITIFIGIVSATLAGLILDFWLYGIWTISWWNYLDQNLFQHAAAQFGEQPFYFYITESLTQLIPPFSLVFVFAICWFWIIYKNHVLTWITLPFVLLHFFIGHKELRFLFPLLDFMPLMICFFLMTIENSHQKGYSILTRKILIKSYVFVNLIGLLIFMFMPADNVSLILKKMYSLSDNQAATLIYAENNPYNNSGSLHYFKNAHIQTFSQAEFVDTIAFTEPVYFFTEEFLVVNTIQVKNQEFEKVYTKFPIWFEYLNFNHWLDRATFGIYKKVTPVYKKNQIEH